MSKIYTFIGVVSCFGDYKGKAYKHDKGVFAVTRRDDETEKAVNQGVELFKLSPDSSVAKLAPGFRGSVPVFDVFGRLVTFNETK